MKYKITFVIIIAVSFILMSCGTTVTQTATVTPAPSVTPTYTITPSPTATPTLIPDSDYDQDGLSNLAETVKYKTNPYSPDSDGDGTADGDWDERREYVYTVHVLMKIHPPFDVNAMNDFFQDVKVVSEPDQKEYTTLDVIIYPDTQIPLTASSYPLTELSDELLELTKPGFSTNYSPEMQEKVLEIVKSAKTDVQAVQQILSWTQRSTKLADLPYQPEVFYYTYLKDGKVYFRNPPDLSQTTMLENLFFADSMFEKRVHGTCCSTATFKCATMKSAGIPCKIIQTLFPIFSHQDQKEEYENKLQRSWDKEFENQPSGKPSWWANHCFMEVYLGNQWVRVDNSINIYHESSGWLSVKILSVPDLTEVDFSKTYPVNWVNNRPYYALLVEDQKPINK